MGEPGSQYSRQQFKASENGKTFIKMLFNGYKVVGLEPLGTDARSGYGRRRNFTFKKIVCF